MRFLGRKGNLRSDTGDTGKETLNVILFCDSIFLC